MESSSRCVNPGYCSGVVFSIVTTASSMHTVRSVHGVRTATHDSRICECSVHNQAQQLANCQRIPTSRLVGRAARLAFVAGTPRIRRSVGQSVGSPTANCTFSSTAFADRPALVVAPNSMGSLTRRQLGRRKSSGSSCGTFKLNVNKMTATKVSGHPRWNALPEGPLLRMFEVMALQDDGRDRLRLAKLVCRTWRAAVREIVLGDTATSRPCRPPMQATSDQAKPVATMNTCGAMMVGSNQSKDACNDEVEVCSKPPQQRGSSSGNMCNMAEESEEAEQAGSVEQPPAPAPRPARRHSYVNKPSAPQRGRRRMFSAPCTQIGAGRSLQATRRITRASAAAAALAAAEMAPQLSIEQVPGARASISQPAVSKSEGADPRGSAEEPSGSFVARPEERGSPAARTSGEVQGTLQHRGDEDCESAPDNTSTEQQTPDQHAVRQESAEMASQTAPGWRMDGVLPIWSILKRFGRRPPHEQ